MAPLQGAAARPARHQTWKADDTSAELNAIKQRRPAADDTTLVGLAISGGGIRSATFGLGVLEGLRRFRVLPRVDYLSTVSGGGYIGAWLSGNCKRQQNWLEPDIDDQTDRWRQSIAYLRRYSNYLSPKVGFFSADTWSMATIWLRNTMLIQSNVILAIAVVLILPRPLFVLFEHWPNVGDLRWLTVALFILGIVGIAGNQWRLTTDRDVPFLQVKSWKKGLALSLALAVAAWAYGSWRGFNPFGTEEVSYLSALPVAGLLVGAGFCLLPTGVWLVASFEGREKAPGRINYDQAWVQRVVIVPLIISAYLVAAILWGETTGVVAGGHLTMLDSYGKAVVTAWRYWPFPLAVVFASIWLLSFFAIRRTGWVAGLLSALPPLVAVPVLHALLAAVMVILHEWAQRTSGGALLAFVWGPPMVSLSFVVTIVVLIGMMSRQSTDGVREWWSRLGAWLGIYATAWMVIAIAALYGPGLLEWAFTIHPMKSLAASGGWIATVAGGLFGGRSGSTGGEKREKSTATQAKEVIAAIAPFLFIAGLLVTIAYALHLVVEANTDQTWDTVARSLLVPDASSVSFLNVSLVILAACAAALALLAWRIDINEFSLNAFYRNRLVRCYLGATRSPGERTPQNFTGFDPDDDILLKDLVDKGKPYGPFHIVNCALNLGGSSDLALHTRHSTIFTLSPLACGSPYVSRNQAGVGDVLGYVDTAVYGGRSGAPSLGQAISVSGAAASPNMGYHTSPMIAFLLTVFNLRLGWWFPNPGVNATEVASPRFNLRYLFAELFGDADDKSPFLMISDGGHFENLAGYELVRRRCRLVIISDAECDPKYTFAGLGTLIRVCEVDFNYRITIDVERIRPRGRANRSEARHAVGTIDYGGGETGVLIYLKASMTGQEDTSVLQYKSSHPTFPHESTGDQFYTEDQFESYRRLGQEVATEAFRDAGDSTEDLLVRARRLLERDPVA